MLQVQMTSFDSVGAATLMSLMFAIYHVFSRRRHSQNRRVENALSKALWKSYTSVNKLLTARFEDYTVVIIVSSKVFKGV